MFSSFQVFCFHIKSLLFFWNLVISSAALGELENNVAAGQSSVNLAIGIEAVVNTTTLLLVENDLDGLAAILLGADTLANNLNGVDDVGEDGVVDSSQSTGTRTLLGEGVARADGALRAGEDTARSNDDNVAVGELLLELTGQSVDCQLLLCQFFKFVVFAKRTAAGSCGNPGGEGRERRWQ